MTKLQRLYSEQGQSPWLDNLTRTYLRDGTLQRMIDDGIRGVTANPTILARAVEGSDAYDEQFASLLSGGCSVPDAYWELTIADITEALGLLRPTYDESVGSDGFVSIEVAPELAHDAEATVNAATDLGRRISLPNLFVKIPATAEGVAAIRTMTARGHNINVTLIFSLERYAEVIEAYLSGLESLVDQGGDPAHVRSVASFFVSRVDGEVDRLLGDTGGPEAVALRGRAAVAQAKLAYEMFRDQFGGQRWSKLAALGSRPQRPLWASTSTKDPAFSDTLYVDNLIGPETVNTMPESTIKAFEDHGILARTIDQEVDEAHRIMGRLGAMGINMTQVGRTLEERGIESFHQSFSEVLALLDSKARLLAHR